MINGSTNRLITERYNSCISRMSGPLSTTVGLTAFINKSGIDSIKDKSSEEIISIIRQNLINAESEGVTFYECVVDVNDKKVSSTFIKCKAENLPITTLDENTFFIGIDVNKVQQFVLYIISGSIQTLGIKLDNKLLISKELTFFSIPITGEGVGNIYLVIYLTKFITNNLFGLEADIEALPNAILRVND